MSVCGRKIGARENFQPLGLRSETDIESLQNQNFPKANNMGGPPFYLPSFYFFNLPLY